MSSFQRELLCAECGSAFSRGFRRCPFDGTELREMEEDPLVGRLLSEKYLVESLLGYGAHGRVLQAKHVKLPRTYAIKVLHGDVATKEFMRMRFHREADSAARLSHPHIVPVIDAHLQEDGISYLVMEYLSGPSLYERIRRDGTFDVATTRSILTKLCGALSHAHEQGLVHRDLKPANVLFRDDTLDSPCITDFGVALSTVEPNVPRLTRVGDLVGTPGFMAPEQIMGSELDGRADLYALGVLGYAMLLGRHPIPGTRGERLDAALDTDLPPASELGAPAGLDEALLRLTARDRKDRPATAEIARRMLTADPTPPAVEESPLPPLTPLRSSRRPYILAATAAAAIGLAYAVGQRATGVGGPQDGPVSEARQSSKARPEPPLPETLLPNRTDGPPLEGSGLADVPELTRATDDADDANRDASAEAAPPPSESEPNGQTRTVERAPRGRPAARRPRATSGRPSRPNISDAALRRLYGQVGASIQAKTETGHPEADAWAETYFGISLMRALENEQTRQQAWNALRTLQRRIQASEAQ